jgi:uncharacterized protein (DUF1330 family)
MDALKAWYASPEYAEAFAFAFAFAFRATAVMRRMIVVAGVEEQS